MAPNAPHHAGDPNAPDHAGEMCEEGGSGAPRMGSLPAMLQCFSASRATRRRSACDMSALRNLECSPPRDENYARQIYKSHELIDAML